MVQLVTILNGVQELGNPVHCYLQTLSDDGFVKVQKQLKKTIGRNTLVIRYGESAINTP